MKSRLFFLLLSFSLFAQNKKLHIFKTSEKIIIDGKLTETTWAKCEKADSFWQQFPYDTSLARTQTVAMLTYDEKYIYVAAICYDNQPEKPYAVQSLKRDFSFPVTDAFAVVFEPFNDKINGYNFGVNPYGSQREGTVTKGGAWGVTTSWDIPWFSATQRTDSAWFVEMAIPFKSIRYLKNSKHWGINFMRNNLKTNETSVWNKVPRNFNVTHLAFVGELLWETPPPVTKFNLALIPYTTFAGNYSHTNKQWKFQPKFGTDAKYMVTPSLNLDMTIYPDFSQADVDRQVTNLTRFSIFFPERRLFFLENQDLFGQLGFRQIRPFFTRRIGLANGQIIPIISGARLSGKVSENTRIGLLNVQTEGRSDLGLNPTNYTVAVLQQQILGRSNITGFFVNKQELQNKEISYEKYNRVAGLEFNFASNDGKWAGKAFYHRSFDNTYTKNPSANASFLMYRDIKWFFMWNHEFVSANYNAETGFVPRIFQYNPEKNELTRIGYFRIEPAVSYRFYPKSKIVNFHGPWMYLSQYYNEDFFLTDRYLNFEYKVKLQNSSEYSYGHEEFYTYLWFPTDITRTMDSLLAPGGYNYRSDYLNWRSNYRKPVVTEGKVSYGSFYSGTKLTINTKLRTRIQPRVFFDLTFRQDEIRFPELQENSSLTQFGLGTEITFTTTLYWNTYFQYVNQLDFVSLYTRLQWRFRPMSDLFIIYVDNYKASDFSNSSRSFFVKLTYWLQL